MFRLRSTRSQLWFWILLVLLSVGVRAAVAFYYGNWVPEMQDDYSYSQLGWRVATGHGYSFDRAWYPFTSAESPTAHWSFLYTAFVAGIYALVGYQPLAVRLVSAVVTGVLLPVLVYRVTRKILPARPQEGVPGAKVIALLAALCAALYAYHVLFAARIMTEGLYTIALLWSLERALVVADALRQGERVSLITALTLGLSLGIAALLRQAILPWAPVLFAWLLFTALTSSRDHAVTPSHHDFSNFKRILLPLFVAGLVLIACIVPFTIRNARVYGEFLLLNSNTGYAMYSAQHPIHGVDFQEHAAAPLPEDLLNAGPMTEPEWDRALMARGIGFVLENPGRYLQLSLSRILDFYEFWPTADTPLLHNIGRLVSFTLFLPFMLYGSILACVEAWREERNFAGFIRQPAVLILGFAGFYALLHIFTWAMPRYRIPVDGVMVPFAALALAKSRVFWCGFFSVGS